MNRREFLGAATAAAATAAPRRSILNFNENMEYRKLGKTGLMVSAVCLGGHWKRVDTVVPGLKDACGYCKQDMAHINNPDFLKNRHEVVSRCIEVGINYIDACTGEEVMAYAKALKGRRQKMYLGYSWYQREPRRPEYRTTAKLLESIDMGLKEPGLDYVDIWRVTMPADELPDLAELTRIEENTFNALEKARKQGKVRFTGISTHNRPWLKSVIEQYPDQVQVICTPYTANSKELPAESVFSAIRKHNVGVFGIKPFANTSLFKGDSSPNNPNKQEDDNRARMALRYILGNPAITAPIPGLVSIDQVNNAAKAIAERRKLDRAETSQLEQASREMWASVRSRPAYRWLREWEYV